MSAVIPISVVNGCDPELFVRRYASDFDCDGEIIGSEEVIPQEGLKAYPGPLAKALVIRDGVQVELNPIANTSLRFLASSLSEGFRLLHERLKLFPDVRICFDGVVDVTRAKLDSLSLSSRQLGCQPSYNIYEPKPITVDPLTYLKRSAGGHIHLGVSDLPFLFSQDIDERQQLIPVLDIFVGLFSVLLDRDPQAAERRKNYGRAGEFRLPSYGVEYRTLSNFWLQNFTLMSFVFGMANFAVAITYESLRPTGNDTISELVDAVDINKVIEAIDTNNFGLARTTIEGLIPFVEKYIPIRGFPLNKHTIGSFLKFSDDVEKRGLDHFFQVDPVEHWLGRDRVDFWEFIDNVY